MIDPSILLREKSLFKSRLISESHRLCVWQKYRKRLKFFNYFNELRSWFWYQEFLIIMIKFFLWRIPCTKLLASLFEWKSIECHTANVEERFHRLFPSFLNILAERKTWKERRIENRGQEQGWVEERQTWQEWQKR